ncbi:MAG: hypothetical protein C3F13_10015 [Anaerolineales bacterium]|nr:MAG: hypothetical protein C3F13_10015 [Anaerolineales bacterium]
MARRRFNHEGSLFQKPNNSWRAMVSVNGKRLSFTSKSRQAALEWLKKTTTQVATGMTYVSAKETLDEFLREWLSINKTSVRHTTWSQYELTCRVHISPRIGHIKLANLDPAVLQKFYSEKMSMNYGKGIRTIRVIHSILHKSLDDALRLGLISRNPVDLVVPPRYTHGEMKIYDRKQVQSLLIAAKDDRNVALYFLTVTTGCRMSELLALKWDDLSWEGQTLHIQRQLARDRQNGYYLPLKTRAANRTIDLGKKSIKKLREHYQRQNLERFNSQDWQENDLIFPSSIGTPLDQFNLYHQFKTLIERAGLPEIRFHDLRHTAASLMINDGLPIIVISRRLGHTKVSTTMDIYGHLLPDTQRELADRIDECVMPIEVELHPNCTRTPEIHELIEILAPK